MRGNRVLVGLRPEDLAGWDAEGSWLMAVLLCPGDSSAAIAAWARRHKADPDRIHFYAHKGTDPFEALAAWHRSGLPPPIVTEGITSWKEFHRRFGRDLTVRILQDWG